MTAPVSSTSLPLQLDCAVMAMLMKMKNVTVAFRSSALILAVMLQLASLWLELSVQLESVATAHASSPYPTLCVEQLQETVISQSSVVETLRAVQLMM